jgi:hypothetical protein
MSWYIVPQTGTMKGFTRIDRRRDGVSGVPGLTGPSDQTFYQRLPAENFKPGAGYLMWFKPNHGLPTGVMVSLNFTTNESVNYRATVEAFEEKRSWDPTERKPALANP